MGEMRNTHKMVVGNVERKNHSGNLGIDGRIILEWVLEKQVFRSFELDSCSSAYGPVAGSCERGNELLGFKNAGNFLTS
jgi:hypothetical protein